MIENTPMGPGFFIFFQASDVGGPQETGVKEYDDDDEVMEIILAIVSVLDAS